MTQYPFVVKKFATPWWVDMTLLLTINVLLIAGVVVTLVYR